MGRPRAALGFYCGLLDLLPLIATCQTAQPTRAYLALVAGLTALYESGLGANWLQETNVRLDRSQPVWGTCEHWPWQSIDRYRRRRSYSDRRGPWRTGRSRRANATT